MSRLCEPALDRALDSPHMVNSATMLERSGDILSGRWSCVLSVSGTEHPAAHRSEPQAPSCLGSGVNASRHC